MFTGLVEGIGKVKELSRFGKDLSITISPLFDMPDTRTGDSISVDGVCLTVTRVAPGSFRLDVSEETLSRSTLHGIKVGDEVDLERTLRVTDRLGGHLVSGHVDGVGRILGKSRGSGPGFFRSVEENLLRYIIEKGSVAVEQISVTVNQCDEHGFEVNYWSQTRKRDGHPREKVGGPVDVDTGSDW